MPTEPSQMTPTMWTFLIAVSTIAGAFVTAFGKQILGRVFGFAMSSKTISIKHERELRLEAEKRIADLLQNYQRGWEELEARVRELNTTIAQNQIAHKTELEVKDKAYRHELDRLHEAHSECLQENARMQEKILHQDERILHLEARITRLEGKTQ